LQNTIERAVALARGDRITPAEISLPQQHISGAHRSLPANQAPYQPQQYRPAQPPQRQTQPVMQDSFARSYNASLNAPREAEYEQHMPPGMPRSAPAQAPVAYMPQPTQPLPGVASSGFHAPATIKPSGFHQPGTTASGFHQQTGPASGFYSQTTMGMPQPPQVAPAHVSPQVILPAEGMDLEKFLLEQERSLIIQALERSNWNLTEAAKILCMTFRSIRYRVAKLAIDRPGKGIDFNED